MASQHDNTACKSPRGMTEHIRIPAHDQMEKEERAARHWDGAAAVSDGKRCVLRPLGGNVAPRVRGRTVTCKGLAFHNPEVEIIWGK